MLDKAVILELGSGVGLASIIASMFANRIFSTGLTFPVKCMIKI